MIQSVKNKRKIDGLFSGSRTIADHWGPDWLDSTPAESPQPQETPAVTADSPLPDAPDTAPLPDVLSDPAEQLPGDFGSADYSEWCWSQTYPADYRYLAAPRIMPERCPWCRGRLVHNPLCDALRRSWEPTLPFGKHKGKPLSEVPRDYLEWLANVAGIDSELRAAVQFQLQPEVSQ